MYAKSTHQTRKNITCQVACALHIACCLAAQTTSTQKQLVGKGSLSDTHGSIGASNYCYLVAVMPGADAVWLHIRRLL